MTTITFNVKGDPKKKGKFKSKLALEEKDYTTFFNEKMDEYLADSPKPTKDTTNARSFERAKGLMEEKNK